MPCCTTKTKILCKSNSIKTSKISTIAVNDIINKPDTTSENNEFSYIYRQKTKWELSRLSLTMMGIEIVYAVITAFASPILLMYGLRREHVTLVWAIGPLMGLFFAPVLGSLSDRCRFSIGRRRPFIIILSILDVIGLLLVANSDNIGKYFGDTKVGSFTYNSSLLYEFLDVDVSENKINNYFWTVIVITVGTVLVDFSSDTLLNPSRAYVLDICVVEDHDRGLNTGTILGSVGGVIGYVIGSIDWNNTILSEIVGNYIKVIFYTVSILFVMCILASVTTFKELPLEKINENFTSDKCVKTHVGLKDYLKSIISMPYALKILCVTNLLSWMPHLNFCLYFTHFVGSTVFQGNPSASSNSTEYELYRDGIRFACIALCVYAVTCLAYSLVCEKLINYFGLKYVYIGSIFLTSLTFLITMLVKHKIFVIVLSAMNGVLYCTIFTIPYVLIAQYHVQNVFSTGKNELSNQVRGLGTDIAVVNTCTCVAQLAISLCMGQIMSAYGIPFAVIGTSAVLGFLAAAMASQIVYPDSSQTNSNIPT